MVGHQPSGHQQAHDTQDELNVEAYLLMLQVGPLGHCTDAA